MKVTDIDTDMAVEMENLFTSFGDCSASREVFGMICSKYLFNKFYETFNKNERLDVSEIDLGD